ncbi:MAG: RdgB/HAM1 family non-canonical purine NTP pyrophosphatase [Oscillospiraceae bacterium]|nr:RdgB/HAM1 family non-canonical purine NTP pyrophosphatase [Oscillospiraceae bacterium]
MKLVLASNNAHKLQELSAILSTLGMEVVSQKEAGVFVEPDETGTTFEENSYIKAKTVMDACGLPTVADDSGLMVDALDGAPGVYSARFGGDACRSDRDRLSYLLSKMEAVPEDKRTAHFVSVITMLTPDGKKIVARGECPGRILREAHGENGFGYDPVFFVPEEGCTFAELPPERKNQISHRARALEVFVQKIREENGNADK